MADLLPSWRDTPTRRTLEAFVSGVVDGPDPVPEVERVAVFDNDGTLWTEKPLPAQLDYVLQEWRAAVNADPALADRQPYRAAVSGDVGWLARAVDGHDAGDDGDLALILEALGALVAGVRVDEYSRQVAEFYRSARHPELGRPYTETVYRPMTELLGYLAAHGFTSYVVSGGERDFVRPLAEQVYGIPPERVVGTAFGLNYDAEARDLAYTADLSFFSDGPEKPARIWSRIGRRPLLACGNSDGDVPMLDFARSAGRPGLALLVHHDDDTGRGDTPYDGGAGHALGTADERGYVVVSVRDDWSTVFP